MSNELIKQNESVKSIQQQSFSREQIDLIKTQITKNSSDAELKLFIMQCKRTGLDPFSKQIYAVKRWNGQTQRNEMNIQTSIDGFRLIAERTGKYDGQDDPLWCGDDGQWVDVWLEKKPPAASKITVYKKNCLKPFTGIAKWDSYAQTKKDGSLTKFWEKMPDLMLAKCAEALALRKAFPQEISGLYTSDEMPLVENTQSQPQAKSDGKSPSEAQLKRLYAITAKSNWQPSDVKDYIQAKFNKTSSKELSIIEYNLLCNEIMNNDPVKEPEVVEADFAEGEKEFNEQLENEKNSENNKE